jgi:hypothetical protein
MKILIVHPEGNYDKNPTILNLLSLRNIDENISIDYFSSRKFYITNNKTHVYNKINIFIYRFFFKIFIDNFNYLKSLNFFLKVLEFPVKYNYNLIIGVDREGLIESYILSNIYNTNFINISFEIMFESETSYIFKKSERYCSQFSKMLIIQDKIRLNLYLRENKIANIKVFYLPVSSSLNLVDKNTNILNIREKYKLPINSKLVLHIGSILDWTCIFDLIKKVDNWPNNWYLVIHGNDSKFKNFSYNKEKVLFTNIKTMNFKDLGSILLSVDFGLVLYKSTFQNRFTGKNISVENIGFASGKFTTFLMFDIPVISNCEGILREEILNNNLGLIIKQLDDLPHTIQKNLYKKGHILNYFCEKMDFNNFKINLLKEFKNLYS